MILGWVQTERTCPSSPDDHGSKKEKRGTESLRPVFFLELELTESLKEATTTDVQYLPDFPQERIVFPYLFRPFSNTASHLGISNIWSPSQRAVHTQCKETELALLVRHL